MARRPDIVALQDFLDGSGRLLRRSAYLVCGSWAQADDLLEQSLLDVLRKGTDPDDATAMERATWPVLVARLRSTTGNAELVDERHDATEPSDRLLQALGALPVDQRAAVVLTHFAHLDAARLGHALGQAPDRTDALLQQGIAALQTDLARTGDHLATPTDDAADEVWRRPGHHTSNTTVEDFEG